MEAIKESMEAIKEGMETKNGDQPIAIVSMMKQPKNIDIWLATHRSMGIDRFYIRLEDSPEVQEYLGQQSDVTITLGQSTGKNEYTDIQTRQNTMINAALQAAAKDGMSWLIHIDSDELLAGQEGALNEIRALPQHVRTFWMQNEEAKYADVPTRSDICFQAAAFVNCAKTPDKCASYGNGKGGGRVAEDVSAHGPHRFKSGMKGAEEVKLSKMIVQHYESCDFDVYKDKFKRLAVQDRDEKIPFSYYNDSIQAAKEGDDALKRVYQQYRTVNS
jgi:hypothetical protein